MTESTSPALPPAGKGEEPCSDHFNLDSYSYDLPEEMIAQVPLEPRDSSRLLVLERSTGTIRHVIFRQFVSFLNPGDAIILNDTRVIKARLTGRKVDGTSRLEIFLLKPLSKPEGELWEVLVRPGRKAPPGQTVLLAEGVAVRILGHGDEGTRICSFPEGLDVASFIERCGNVPLPPYIKNVAVDPERYQTVYARQNGSVAAPTAGLHFTPSLLSEIGAMGIETGRITLNVGLGTFSPVKTADIRQHMMHSEDCFIPEETGAIVRKVKSSGGRVIAVGTTVVRALESRTMENGEVAPGSFSTRAFFYPGYRFKTVDAMITNFHIPRSSLIMLVSAFAGLDLTMRAYRVAVNEKYRFYSFGDAMLIL
ncbi:MAG: tRNA preQ1(34) S-adenosylmethionine ribosyltransferase-isomerase QueA [Thermovirgaceae bacterium]|nr:tRNA preQ1(34) S-adenosylmethionine ribosyltransferase-isomerase QueA [Thermovirgaceae bacterium]